MRNKIKTFRKTWDKKKQQEIFKKFAQTKNFFKRLKHQLEKYILKNKKHILSLIFNQISNQYHIRSTFRRVMLKLNRKFYQNHKKYFFLNLKIYAIKQKVINSIIHSISIIS